MSSYTILVVDDEKSMRDFLKILLQKEGYNVETANSTASAFEFLQNSICNLVISDIRMPGESGLVLLARIKEHFPGIPVIMITAFASPDDAVFAMKNGAFDYISKPFNVDEIKSVIESATSGNHKEEKKEDLAAKFSDIIGRSKELTKIFDVINRIAPTPANVLIYGESGTGKELVAQAIHKHSKAGKNAFVPINCAAIPEELMESELFGHVKGSFTGAINDKHGLFMQANNGTVFLDEIGELPLLIQSKLLRVLQEREIKPVGSTQIYPINVRIIAATNRVLEDEITEGRFREDLFYRLAVVPIRVPSLRERKSDIPLLVDFFLEKYSHLLGKEVQKMSSYALEVLMNYDFPGNVRELENIIERGVAMSNSNIILPETLTLNSSQLLGAAPSSDPEDYRQEINPLFCAVQSEEELLDIGLEEVIARLERNIIAYALEKNGNSKMKAADMLRVSFRSLRYKTKKYNLG